MTRPPASSCPAACGGGTDFEENIECSNPTAFTCGASVGTATSTIAADTSVFPDGMGGPSQTGVKCLIHQNGGSGQDILNSGVSGALTYPLEIQVGGDHPLAGSLANSYVTTSDSLVTVPVYNDIGAPGPPAGAPTPGGVQIIGFLQLFINRAFPGGGPNAGSFDVTVVNVAGCGSSATGTPVFTGSTSAVPVRLIHQ